MLMALCAGFLVGFLRDDNNTQIVISYRRTQDMKKYPAIILPPLWHLLFPFRQPIQITLLVSHWSQSAMVGFKSKDLKFFLKKFKKRSRSHK